MASISVPEVVAVALGILQIFMGSNPTEQEIAAFISAIVPYLGPNAPKSGSIPAFRVGPITFGPIPFTD